jgi:conjugal transfer pilus assembly protein TraW
MPRFLLMVIVCAGCFGAGAAYSQRAVGPVYEIAEPDMLDEVQAKAKALEGDPEFQKRLQQDRQRAVNRTRNPAPVEGLGLALRYRTSYYDPTIVVEEDITTPDGATLARRGDRVNPLTQIPWRYTWIFFDGRDDRQVAAVRVVLQARDRLVRPVLVAGSPIELSRVLKHRVYFDQQGLYVRQFGIRTVPASVRQEGHVLRIDEFPAGEAIK